MLKTNSTYSKNPTKSPIEELNRVGRFAAFQVGIALRLVFQSDSPLPGFKRIAIARRAREQIRVDQKALLPLKKGKQSSRSSAVGVTIRKNPTKYLFCQLSPNASNLPRLQEDVRIQS
jgi:hypothetical protein